MPISPFSQKPSDDAWACDAVAASSDDDDCGLIAEDGVRFVPPELKRQFAKLSAVLPHKDGGVVFRRVPAVRTTAAELNRALSPPPAQVTQPTQPSTRRVAFSSQVNVRILTPAAPYTQSVNSQSSTQSVPSGATQSLSSLANEPAEPRDPWRDGSTQDSLQENAGAPLRTLQGVESCDTAAGKRLVPRGAASRGGSMQSFSAAAANALSGSATQLGGRGAACVAAAQRAALPSPRPAGPHKRSTSDGDSGVATPALSTVATRLSASPMVPPAHLLNPAFYGSEGGEHSLAAAALLLQDSQDGLPIVLPGRGSEMVRQDSNASAHPSGVVGAEQGSPQCSPALREGAPRGALAAQSLLQSTSAPSAAKAPSFDDSSSRRAIVPTGTVSYPVGETVAVPIERLRSSSPVSQATGTVPEAAVTEGRPWRSVEQPVKSAAPTARTARPSKKRKNTETTSAQQLTAYFRRKSEVPNVTASGTQPSAAPPVPSSSAPSPVTVSVKNKNDSTMPVEPSSGSAAASAARKTPRKPGRLDKAAPPRTRPARRTRGRESASPGADDGDTAMSTPQRSVSSSSVSTVSSSASRQSSVSSLATESSPVLDTTKTNVSTQATRKRSLHTAPDTSQSPPLRRDTRRTGLKEGYSTKKGQSSSLVIRVGVTPEPVVGSCALPRAFALSPRSVDAVEPGVCSLCRTDAAAPLELLHLIRVIVAVDALKLWCPQSLARLRASDRADLISLKGPEFLSWKVPSKATSRRSSSKSSAPPHALVPHVDWDPDDALLERLAHMGRELLIPSVDPAATTPANQSTPEQQPDVPEATGLSRSGSSASKGSGIPSSTGSQSDAKVMRGVCKSQKHPASQVCGSFPEATQALSQAASVAVATLLGSMPSSDNLSQASSGLALLCSDSSPAVDINDAPGPLVQLLAILSIAIRKLMGPIDPKAERSEYVHEACCLWSAGVDVTESEKSAVGVREMLGRSRQARCSLCGRLGASLGCWKSRLARPVIPFTFTLQMPSYFSFSLRSPVPASHIRPLVKPYVDS